MCVAVGGREGGGGLGGGAAIKLIAHFHLIEY